MTRVLSELLEAREPQFQQTIRQLESVAGHPNADIRMTDDIQQAVRAQLRELHLDASDTTGRELYAALRERLQQDEERFEASLGVTGHDDANGLVARALEKFITPRQCFAMKSSVAKKLLRANLPKKTMKQLGYRSVESMLKHETPASLFAAAWLIESSLWSKKIVAGYSKLGANDFETRDIALEAPDGKRWQNLSETVVAQHKHHVLSFKELGAVVILPLPAQRPRFSTLTTAVMTLHAVNEIRAAGTYLKLHQMQSGFGGLVQHVVLEAPLLHVASLDQPISWHSLHRYFARIPAVSTASMFEPLLAASELAWTEIEDTLASIESSLSFWSKGAHVAMLDDGKVVSCNLTDALLSHGNQLTFDERIGHYFKQTLSSELLLKYFAQGKLDQLIIGDVRHRLAPEMATY